MDSEDNEYTTPQQFTVSIRFHSYDPRNMLEINDVVEFVLKSSKEDYSDFCDFTALEILEPIANPDKTYNIAEGKAKEI
jgi:hypothetical protein